MSSAYTGLLGLVFHKTLVIAFTFSELHSKGDKIVTSVGNECLNSICMARMTVEHFSLTILNSILLKILQHWIT